MMQFQCPYCQFINSFESDTMGKAVACGHCSQVQQAPSSRMQTGIVLGDFVLGGQFRSRMGTTDFEGMQLSLERPVLLKIVDPEQRSNKRFIKDFLRMARSASQTLHPNLIYIFAAGLEGGCYYVAREPAAGQPLAKLLRREGRLSPNMAIRIISQVAEALAYAWRAKQLIHGNLKPDYILVDDLGHVKLLDLGLAMLDPEPEDDSVKGTPHYLSPERIQGEPLDMRVDIYSLGVILYEALTGELPFNGETQLDVLHAHLMQDPVPPHTLVNTISEDLSRVVLAMLARDPAERYPNGAILAEDLRLVAARQAPKFAQALERMTNTARVSKSLDQADFLADETDDDFVSDDDTSPAARADGPGSDTSAVDSIMAQASEDAKTAFNFRTGVASREKALAELQQQRRSLDDDSDTVKVKPTPAPSPNETAVDEPDETKNGDVSAPAASAPAEVKKAIPIDPNSEAAIAAREKAEADAAAQAAQADDDDDDDESGPEPEYVDELTDDADDQPNSPKKKTGKSLFGPGKKKKTKFKFKTTSVRLPPRRPPEP